MSRSLDARVCSWIVIVSLASLGFAFTLQYGFGVDPCLLCKYQRIPYAVATGFGLLGMILPLGPSKRRTVVMFCTVLFFAGTCLALYHLGIEQAWWGGSAGCTGENLSAPMTLNDISNALSTKPKARCDAVPWTLFGLSLTTLNLIWSALLTFLGIGLIFERRIWRERRFAGRF